MEENKRSCVGEETKSSSNAQFLMKQSTCQFNDVVLHCLLESISDKCAQIPRNCEQLPVSALRIINGNYSHHNGKLGQLPAHLTSFPPVSVTVLFIPCFFLYESIHHEHFKRLALQFALNSLCLSHLSLFPCVWKAVQSSLAHQHPRNFLSSLPRMYSCFYALHWLESLFLF